MANRSKLADALRGTYYGGVQQPRDVIAALYASALSDGSFDEYLNQARQGSLEGEQGLAQEQSPLAFGAGQLGGNIAASIIPASAATRAVGAAGPLLSKIPAVGGKAAQLAAALSAGSGVTGTLGKGAIEGAVAGGLLEGDPLMGAAGGAAGSGLFALGGRIAKPVRDMGSAARQGFVNTLKNAGIDDLSLGQITGGRGSELAESVLANMPFTAGTARNKAEGQLRKFTQEAMRTAGINADDFSPAVREAAEQQFKQRYGDLVNNVTVNVDAPVLDMVADVTTKQLDKLPTNVKPVIQSYLQDIVQSGGQLTGEAYQQARSQLTQQARSMTNTDPFTANVLRTIRNSLDYAAERSLPVQSKGAWRELNRQYGNYKTLQKAGSRVSQDSLEGLISPSALLSAVETANKTKSQAGYGDLYDLARAGRSVLVDSVPNSGTAQRQLAQSLLTGGAVTGLGVAGGLDAQSAAQLGLGAVALPKAAQYVLNNPNYLVNGIPFARDLVGRTGAIGGVMGGSLGAGEGPDSAVSIPTQEDRFNQFDQMLSPQQNQRFNEFDMLLQGAR